jgi:hypothetical protein
VKKNFHKIAVSNLIITTPAFKTQAQNFQNISKLYSMEDPTTLKENIREYVDTQIKIAKLKAINKAGPLISGILVGALLTFLGIFILIFLSISAALAISTATGHPYMGFLLVGVFYLILAVLIVALKEKLVTLPIINALLKSFYSDKKK